jgi:hypothetical protein
MCLFVFSLAQPTGVEYQHFWKLNYTELLLQTAISKAYTDQKSPFKYRFYFTLRAKVKVGFVFLQK